MGKTDEYQFDYLDEFLSGMSKEEKFMPVITLVVYCGTEHPWDGARCLRDLLEVDEERKGFVSNYRLNLYDCHEHDTLVENVVRIQRMVGSYDVKPIYEAMQKENEKE